MRVLFVSQFFPLVIATLFAPGRVRSGSALAALATGVAVTAFFTIGPMPRPGGFHPGFLGLAANAAVLLGGAVTRNENKLNPI